MERRSPRPLVPIEVHHDLVTFSGFALDFAVAGLVPYSMSDNRYYVKLAGSSPRSCRSDSKVLVPNRALGQRRNTTSCTSPDRRRSAPQGIYATPRWSPGPTHWSPALTSSVPHPPQR